MCRQGPVTGDLPRPGRWVRRPGDRREQGVQRERAYRGRHPGGGAGRPPCATTAGVFGADRATTSGDQVEAFHCSRNVRGVPAGRAGGVILGRAVRVIWVIDGGVVMVGRRVVISAHFDDAVLSCWRAITGAPRRVSPAPRRLTQILRPTALTLRRADSTEAIGDAPGRARPRGQSPLHRHSRRDAAVAAVRGARRRGGRGVSLTVWADVGGVDGGDSRGQGQHAEVLQRAGATSRIGGHRPAASIVQDRGT